VRCDAVESAVDNTASTEPAIVLLLVSSVVVGFFKFMDSIYYKVSVMVLCKAITTQSRGCTISPLPGHV
jgi:hypothetical protein